MKFMRLDVALVSVLSLSSVVYSQDLPPDLTRQVDKVFEKWNRTDSPGCALGVYKDGQIVYKRGYGMANLNDDVTITPETVFHVASMSKQFTAAAILLLAAAGKALPRRRCTQIHSRAARLRRAHHPPPI